MQLAFIEFCEPFLGSIQPRLSVARLIVPLGRKRHVVPDLFELSMIERIEVLIGKQEEDTITIMFG